MSEADGASPREIVVEACRRDQPHLIDQVIASMNDKTNEQVAEFFNGVTDSMGNYALHICAMYGSYDTMDVLFDIEFFECDPQNRLDRDAPLHIAVKYANEKDAELGLAMIKMMTEAGCDPRVRNKGGLKAENMLLKSNPQADEIRKVLAKAEYMYNEGIHAAEEERRMEEEGGSGSESD
ncbi:ankyrin repeat protein [Ascosphaera apis ARSEF 7405]|uniref:Ankyrin repeat protein n=1 Tax=Ascosphaera apis ARSEF 7405 TaxID=392613 RepID=A0A167XF61_9EURO|nr:ankyrin repeat protein [Ascosphaera apis ARSEF 7405]